MKDFDQKVIIVAYASTGSGHQSAAEAIYQYLIKNTNHLVYMIDALDYCFRKIDGNSIVRAFNGSIAPVFDITWRKNFTGKITWGGGKLWPKFLYKKLEDYIIEKKPDLVISTHFVCANTAVLARMHSKNNFKIISVPTDFETEGLWPHSHTDLFCVSNDIMKSTLMQRKVEESKIIKTGIPINKSFSANYNKQTVLSNYKIPNGKKVVVIIAGANENGPYRNFRKVIDSSWRSFCKMKNTYFVVCTGRDNKYAQKVLRKTKRGSNVRVVTYTKNLARLISIADVAVIKPGGLMLSECIEMNLPFILVGKTYAQESVNRAYFTSEQVTTHITTNKGLIDSIQSFLSDPEKYKAVKSKMLKLKNSDAAKKIVEAALEMPDNTNVENKKAKTGIYIGNAPVHTW